MGGHIGEILQIPVAVGQFHRKFVEGFLAPFAAGDIPIARPVAQKFARTVIHGLTGVPDPALFPVFGDNPEFQHAHPALRHGLPEMIFHLGLVVRMDDLQKEPGIVPELFRSISGDSLRGRGDIEKISRRIQPVFPVVGKIRNGAELFLADQYLGLGLFPLTNLRQQHGVGFLQLLSFPGKPITGSLQRLLGRIALRDTPPQKAAAEQHSGHADEPSQTGPDKMGNDLFFLKGQRFHHGQADTDSAPEVPLLIALMAVALETILFHQHRLDQPQMRHPVNVAELDLFRPPGLDKLLKTAALPGIRRIFRTQRLEAGHPGDPPIGACKILAHLPHHVGRIHQGEFPAGGRYQITFGKMREIWICRSALVDRHIHSAMGSRPGTQGAILVAVSPDFTDGHFPGDLPDTVYFVKRKSADEEGPNHYQEPGKPPDRDRPDF